jgi:very-short-patch-repair endonuclease
MKDSHRIRGTTREIEQAARILRKNMTPAEDVLWKALNNRQIEGFRFRRQHPMGRFILDFYCPQLKLAIEVDGDIHNEQQEYDQNRDQKLQEFGCYILRFSNHQILLDLPNVIKKITQITKTLSHPILES